MDRIQKNFGTDEKVYLYGIIENSEEKAQNLEPESEANLIYYNKPKEKKRDDVNWRNYYYMILNFWEYFLTNF